MLHTENKQISPVEEIDLDSDPATLAAYYKELFAATRTNGDELRELLESEDRTAFDERLQTLAEELADGDTEFNDNVEKLKIARRNSRLDKSELRVIIDRQKDIIEAYKQIIIAECNLPDEARFSELETAKKNINTILSEAYGDKSYTRDEALTTLGVISIDNDNSVSYHFPNHLVPPAVLEKWETYLAAVCSHVEAADNLATSGDKDAVMSADATRRYAHDSIALDFKDIFGLGLDKESSRQILAKIRDQVFPDHATASSSKAKEFMDAHDQNLTVVKYLMGYHH